MSENDTYPPLLSVEYNAPTWGTMEHEAERFEDFTRMLVTAGVITSEQSNTILLAIQAQKEGSTQTGAFTL